MSDGHGSGIEKAQEHHIVSPKVYLVVFFALLVGTALTVLASFFDLGEWHIAPGLTLFWNPVVALAIASTKMILVVLFFMHIKYSTRLDKAHDRSGRVRVPGADRDDALRLHQPRVGAVVEKQLSVFSLQKPPAGGL